LNEVELLTGDFANRDDLQDAVKKVDYIFHFIGTTLPQSSTQNPIYDIESNVIPTVQLLELARSAGVKKIIFSSSGGTVYGIPQKIPISEDHPTNPVSAYGISKLLIEKYLNLYFHLHALDYTVFRISNAYGGRQNPYASQGAVAVFLGNVLKGDPIPIWGDGNVVRDFVHIEDIVSACQRALEMNPSDHHVFNIGSGVGTSLNQLIEGFKKHVKKDVVVQYMKARRIDVPINILDIQLAREVLQWVPVISLEEGLRRVVDDVRDT